MRFASNALLLILLTAFSAPQAQADAFDPPSDYYTDAVGTAGTLKGQLTSIMASGQIQRTYGNFRDSAAITDADPNHPGNILLVYNRASVPGVWDPDDLPWNREHLWPVSRQPGGEPSNGTTGNKGDPHALRPANPQINSNRGNSPFGFDATTGTHRYINGTHYYPGDADAGDVARQLFYSDTRYGSTLGISLTENFPGPNQMGDLSSLVAWHYRDAPDTFERRRNQAIYDKEMNPLYYTNNRNAFIDRPEFVWSVYVDQQNDSQLAFDGAAPDAGGASALAVDLGRVLVNAPAPAARTVTINRGGVDGTYFSVTPAGDATSSLTGRYNAFPIGPASGRSFQVGLAATTEAPGLKSGMVTVDNLDVTTQFGAGHGATDNDDVATVSLSVLDHANPSFSGAVDDDLQVIDFGSIALGAVAPTVAFDLFNLVAPSASAAFTAGLDLDGFVGSGDTTALATTLAPFTAANTLAAGGMRSFLATLDTSTIGSFAATYTLAFSDENLPGAASLGPLTLNLTGTVVAATAFNANFDGDDDVDGDDLLAWQRGLGTDDAARIHGDADGDEDVDEVDLSIWRDQFAEPPPSATAAAPEPSAAVLAAGVLWAACFLRRREPRRRPRRRIPTGPLQATHLGI